MYLSKYFLPIFAQGYKHKTTSTLDLMQRAGIIKKESSGIYSWMPFGFKLLKNVENIVRQELDLIGCLEMLVPCIQSSKRWEESGRIDAYGKELLKIKDRHEQDLLFAPTAEESVTFLAQHGLKSYKDLPQILYQIQVKFRDEIRPRGGLLRSREFIMKDAYSFDVDKLHAQISYKKICAAYFKIYKRLNLKVILAHAESGAIGGQVNHEFHVLTQSEHSRIYYDVELKRYMDKFYNTDVDIDLDQVFSFYAKTQDVHQTGGYDCTVEQANSIEVGHVFLFGDKYSKVFNATFSDTKGSLIPMYMGSYGIGISRLVQVLIETNKDDRGIKLPLELAPFQVSIVLLAVQNQNCMAIAKQYYDQLNKRGVRVVLDNTEHSAHLKRVNNSFIGVPLQIFIGNDCLYTKQVEVFNRDTNQSLMLTQDSVVGFILTQI